MEILLTILISSITCALGIFATIYITKSKKPLWYAKLNPLFNSGVSRIDDLSITYKGNDVNNLSSCYIAFWNNGKETIKAEDVVDPISLCVNNGYKIYHAEIIDSNEVTTNFKATVSDDGSFVDLSFKYLDYKQGAVIQLFTNCTRKNQLSLQGQIMGCKVPQMLPKIKSQSIRILYYLPVFIIFSLLLIFQNSLPVIKDINKVLYEFLLVLFTTISIIAVRIIEDLTKLKHKIPKNLRLYFYEWY